VQERNASGRGKHAQRPHKKKVSCHSQDFLDFSAKNLTNLFVFDDITFLAWPGRLGPDKDLQLLIGK